MSFLLIRDEDGKEFSCTNWFWGKVIDLAIDKYGWEPELTTLIGDDGEEDENFTGTYMTNDGQRVSEIDARNMINALVKVKESELTKGEYKHLQTLIEWSQIEEDGEMFHLGFEIH